MMNGFIAENWKLNLLGHPIEDSYTISSDIEAIAVADGVTRDPTPYLPDKSTLAGKLKFVLSYEKPSRAKRAADDFTEVSPELLREYKIKDHNAIRQVFELANNTIAKRSQIDTPNPDYLTNDFPGCVAALTSYFDGAIHWGFICDCGLSVIDEKGNIKFRTLDEGPSKIDEQIWPKIREKLGRNINWRMPAARREIRSIYRNNPQEINSYGVLTGEEAAMHYVRTGFYEAKPSDTLLVYSDGISELMFNKDGDIKSEFASKIKVKDFKGLEKMCKKQVHSEGTLVCHIK